MQIGRDQNILSAIVSLKATIVFTLKAFQGITHLNFFLFLSFF